MKLVRKVAEGICYSILFIQKHSYSLPQKSAHSYFTVTDLCDITKGWFPELFAEVKDGLLSLLGSSVTQTGNKTLEKKSAYVCVFLFIVCVWLHLPPAAPNNQMIFPFVTVKFRLSCCSD